MQSTTQHNYIVCLHETLLCGQLTAWTDDMSETINFGIFVFLVQLLIVWVVTLCTLWCWQVCASSYNSNLLLDVLCHSTCFGCLHAHHQELTTALTASGFTLERDGSSIVSHGRLYAHHQELTTSLTASGFTLERGGSSVVSRGLARLTTLLPPRSNGKNQRLLTFKNPASYI
jgi:hypothetical protein